MIIPSSDKFGLLEFLLLLPFTITIVEITEENKNLVNAANQEAEAVVDVVADNTLANTRIGLGLGLGLGLMGGKQKQSKKLNETRGKEISTISKLIFIIFCEVFLYVFF